MSDYLTNHVIKDMSSCWFPGKDDVCQLEVGGTYGLALVSEVDGLRRKEVGQQSRMTVHGPVSAAEHILEL